MNSQQESNVFDNMITLSFQPPENVIISRDIEESSYQRFIRDEDDDDNRMQIENEIDAFGHMDWDASIILPAQPSTTTTTTGPISEIVLDIIHLNEQQALRGKQIGEGDSIVKVIDYIHCKAFGGKTGIKYNKEKDGFMYDDSGYYPLNPYYPILLKKKSKLALLMEIKTRSNGTRELNIILMAILTSCINEKDERALDIWSLAKNPHYFFKDAFFVFLQKLKERIQEKEQRVQEKQGQVPRPYLAANLMVDNSNSNRMTEQGRLRLYTSLGFGILPGTPLSLIYPPLEGVLKDQDEENRGALLINTNEGDLVTYLGNIKSVGNNHIIMVASYEDLGEKFDVYCGYKDCFQGNACLLFDEEERKYAEVPINLVDNGKVDIAPFTSGDISYRTIVADYHMSIQKVLFSTSDKVPNNLKTAFPNNNFLDFIEVPDNFVIFTTTSPGSVLPGNHSAETENFVSYVISKLYSTNEETNMENFKKFLHYHRSTAKLPIYNIITMENLEEIITHGDQDSQLHSAIQNTLITENLGRQPIFQLPTNQLGEYQRYQIDFQIYTPGMRMFNYGIGRQSNNDYPNKDHDEAQGNKDDNLFNMGTYTIVLEDNTIKYGNKLDDEPFVNSTETNTIENYLEHLKGLLADQPTVDQNGKPLMTFLFLFGCAIVSQPEGEQYVPFELFYELSHRRSIVYNTNEYVTLDNHDFIQETVFGKNEISEYNCGEAPLLTFSEIRGGKRKGLRQTKRKRKMRSK